MKILVVEDEKGLREALVEKRKGTVAVTSENGRMEFTACLPCA